MTILYRSRWVLPVASAPICDGALVVSGEQIAAVGKYADLIESYPEAQTHDLGNAAIIPGLINAHSHLELTAMRGFLEAEESDFFAWLKKLTMARLERMTAADLYVSAAWGACEAARAGVTCVGDAGDAAEQSMKALGATGLRGIVYQESFGPDARLARENFEKLKTKVAQLREWETPLVRAGVSPHAPYTVCAAQLEMISDFALAEKLPVMMHTAESESEELLLREGRGPFASSFAKRGIEWPAPHCSTVQHLARHGILRTRPLLTHCINVDDADIQTIKESEAGIAHCPKSNAKLGHGRAPWAKFLVAGIPVGLGSDSVASNNTCDILEEARFAVLFARGGAAANRELPIPNASDALKAATLAGARAMGLATEIGTLEAGRQADFVAVSFDGIQQRPFYEPLGTLVFASSGHDVIMTVVAGRVVFRDGHMTMVDEEQLRARMDEIAEKLRS
ncbi:MAG: Cytosine deaminase-like metal-dependent hydrolase [Acidobacteria bacterium]|nr:Cytosine deaminase-like metal-dependent hydrolase [Acidobacteriota bacterium]